MMGFLTGFVSRLAGKLDQAASDDIGKAVVEPVPFSRAESAAIDKRRRSRQWVIVTVLVLMIAMFYGITIVKLGQF